MPGVPLLEWRRAEFRDAEAAEREARRTWAAAAAREGELLRAIDSLEITLRGASGRHSTDAMRDEVEDLRREHHELGQQKTACLQMLELCRSRTQSAERAWRDAEVQLSRLQSLVPQQERRVARQRQLVVQAERELDRQRQLLDEAEGRLGELRAELARVNGGREP